MPIDREATLRQADKLYRQGRIDLAIAEYVRLVEDQPRDWNSINALGDLYLKAGDTARAVTQFTQIADHLFAEGFYPKAAALYKKALKVSPQHEHTLLRLSDIAAAQELLADARAYLRQLWEIRSERGDDAGAADCLVRLARLPEADVDTVLTGARASKALGNTASAVELFRVAADRLDSAGRTAAALEALSQVAVLDPGDTQVRHRLASEYVAMGQLDQAEQFVHGDGTPDPDLLMILARIQFSRQQEGEARTTLTRLLVTAPARADEVLSLAGERGRAGEAHQAFACAETVVDDAVLRGEWDRAIEVLQSLLSHGEYVPALQKLLQVASDAGTTEVADAARERLADAYLEQGAATEARAIAETLLERDYDSSGHLDRLRRALQLAGVEDLDASVRQVQQRLRGSVAEAEAPLSERVDADILISEFTEEEFSDAPYASAIAPIDIERIDIEPAEVAAVELESPTLPSPVRTDLGDAPTEEPLGPMEFDLSDALAALGGPTMALPVSSAAVESPETTPAPAADLESVFDAMRPRSADYRSVTDGAALYELGLQRLEAGQVEDALADLERASRVPALRFSAAARLGREYVGRGRVQTGIHWLERAAEMPPPSPEDGLAVLYDLAVALQENEEHTRALAVLMEIESEAGEYRDVRERIDGLARQPKGRRA